MLSKLNIGSKRCARDEAAFERLFLEQYQRVYGVLARLVADPAEAEDLTQQVFLKLYHVFDQFQDDAKESQVVGWLYRVAVNQGYDSLRQHKRRAGWQERFMRWWVSAASPSDPARLAEHQDTQTQVRRILAEMKPRQAKLLLLRHSGLSYDEVAAALNIAPGSVGPLLTQAKRVFAKKYRRVFGDEIRD